ncbi:hypothetical protein [Leptolyngbya sp. NIES-2104]|uniref:hypothetical protein n=1 Tax=Leptolyngbya sp. NIES-2104 TaxID=1552121 RepID=UPI0006ECBF63|nr:hypothetical protein [Leptolyngbya sp. NIES-2104]GAQ00185.1 hypothetical protein NIES2104_67500 [Leptolyngbya sp. NIES-2104]
MVKPIGYFGGNYNHPAIAQFSEQFEDMSGNCKELPDNDQSALLAVLSVHAWGLKSGLEEDFWTNAEHAIGDGVETTAETEEPDAPMTLALEALSTLSDAAQCYSLIAWLVQ